MATPIGNLRDVSLRALDVLKAVDVVAAEDTRVTSRLLAHYAIGTKLMALHQHNERAGAERLIALLAAGKSVALVSDAGTPAVSDPGAKVVAMVRAAGHRVESIPGASALLAALAASGIADPHFLFYGFLPQQGAARCRALEALQALPYTLAFYEAPHRVQASLTDMASVLGGARDVVIARELTKLFETIHVCKLGDAAAWLGEDGNRLKGEFVLLVSGAQAGADAVLDEGRHVLEILLAELPLKQAVKLAAEISGAKKNALYEIALVLTGKNSG
ncbi:MAG: 16S rRNA (cytidine(1402)-2'-O)-methyltransferase [Pseudomonadota bacterium]